MEHIFTPRVIEKLLAWYDKNRRELPWRETRDPYCIWLSEIMLQQTRVEAVKPYYHRFLEACPHIEALAVIPEEHLMKLWEGLGYYSRARNLQRAAREVVENHGGEMPHTYTELIQLPGIGDYTAGAVASIAFGERAPAIDGNVLRVLSRLMGSYEDIMLPETKKKWREELLPLIPPRSGDFNQALIELGATVCVPNGEVRCACCPMREACTAHEKGIVSTLPVRSAKKPRRIEKKTVLILQDEGHTALSKRPPKGLLAGLYQLPNIEGHLDRDAVISTLAQWGLTPLEIDTAEPARHVFTHIEWHMIAYRVRIGDHREDVLPGSGLVFIPNRACIGEYAIPSAFSSYMKYLQ